MKNYALPLFPSKHFSSNILLVVIWAGAWTSILVVKLFSSFFSITLTNKWSVTESGLGAGQILKRGLCPVESILKLWRTFSFVPLLLCSKNWHRASATDLQMRQSQNLCICFVHSLIFSFLHPQTNKSKPIHASTIHLNYE